MRLREIFPGVTVENWPWSLLNVSGPPYEQRLALIGQLDDGLKFSDVDVRVSGGNVAVTAKLSANPLFELRTLVTARFPSFEMAFAPGESWSSDFRASVATDGSYTFEIDKLPLHISIPGDLLSAHPTKAGATSGVTLTSGAGDSSIEATFRLRVANGAPHLDPHLPLSIGPCTLTGIPLLAIHDLRFLATPGEAHLHYDWCVRPLDPDSFPFDCGGLGFGGLTIDWATPTNPLREIRRLLTISKAVDWVFEDIVIPAMFFPPLPQHGTFGLRRDLQPRESVENFLAVDHHVLQGNLTDDVTLFLDQLFFRTPPEARNVLDGLSLEGGISVAYSGPDKAGERGRVNVALGIIDGDLIRLTIERTAARASENVAVLHTEFFGLVDIDIIRGRIGFAASRVDEGVGEALHLIGDILIKGRESEGDRDSSSSRVTLKTPDDKPFSLGLVDVGWDRGTFNFRIESEIGAIIRLGPFALAVSELGFVQEDGATYFSLSGGVVVAIEPFEGGVFFKRLRFKTWGSPAARDLAFDGVGGKLEIKDVVELEFYGFYDVEVLGNGDRIKEHGLVGSLAIYLGGMRYALTFDLLWGELFPADGNPNVDYFLIQILFEAQLVLATAEMRSIRVIFANNMLPDVDDDDRRAGELIYYEWLKRTKPSEATPERRLEAWKPTAHAVALGMGFGVSFLGCGGVCLLEAFGLGFDSEDESGLVIALEVFLLGSRKPMALGVFEYDFRSGAFVLLIAFDISLDKLIANFPQELQVKLTGTIVFANQPGLVAFGRLDKVDTWIGAKIELKLAKIVNLDLHVAICFEWMENVHIGAGFIAKLSIKGDLGIVLIEGWGSLEILLVWMSSGTSDFAARIAFELGLALTLFRFLRLGIVLELLAEWLAHTPDYFVFRFTVRIETPWFLPDISFSVEHVEGSVAPAERSLIAAPLLDGSGRSRAGTRALRIARADGLAGGERSTLLTLAELGAARATYVGEDVPVPLDAVIAIELSDTIADMLGLGEGKLDARFGRQSSGDADANLEARYELVGLKVRRRPQGTSDEWTTIESLSSASDAPRLRWQWDQTKRVGDDVAPKRLELNGSTPFFVQLDGRAVDEAILRSNPSFPCCADDAPDLLRFDFSEEARGPQPTGFLRRIDGSAIIVRGGPCVVRTPFASGGEEAIVGGFTLPARTETWSRPLFHFASPDELAMVRLRIAMTSRDPYQLRFRARDAAGTLVFDQAVPVMDTSNFHDLSIEAGKSFRTLEIVASMLPQQVQSRAEIRHDLVELDHALVLTTEALERWQRDRVRCERRNESLLPPTINFLPQQEYEVIVRTQVSVRHSTTEWETTPVEERIAFVTAGPPGLNEPDGPGGDLRPYVRSAHAGGRGLLYREEPVNLAIDPALRLFGTGTPGEDEHGLRVPATLTIQPQVDADSERAQQHSSFESEDWFVTHRGETFLFNPWVSAPLRLVDVHSEDPRARRMEELIAASTGECPEDPVWRELLPVFWILPFAPEGATLWAKRRRYRAALRRRDAPVVRREPFAAADVSAFAGVTGGWRVTDEGRLEPTATGSTGYFGDATWDHTRVLVIADVGAGGSVGLAVLADPADPARGLRFEVTGGELIAARGGSGAVLERVPLVDAAETINLVVETFADRVRCTAGGASVHVSRLGVGPGACAILATAASIRALHVRGIELYGFDLETSRYESFGQHVGSFEALELLAVGAESRPLTDVGTEQRDQIVEAMSPTASDGDRERVFQLIAEAVALPQRETVERVHLTEVRAGSDRWFLFESPEPMDFVEEIDVVFERFQPGSPGLPPIREQLSPRELLLRPVLPALPIGQSIPLSPRPTPPPPFERGELPADRIVNLPRAISPALLAALAKPRVAKPSVPAATTNTTRTISPVAARNPRRDLLSRVDIPPTRAASWASQPVLVIQNALATKALIIPTGSLALGRHRLRLALTRRWIHSDDPPAPETAYMREARIEFELV